MKKLISTLTIILYLIVLNVKSQNNLSPDERFIFNYSTVLYNSIKINNVNYDQYEVTVKFGNSSGNYIYSPNSCIISFKNGLEQPKFGSVPYNIAFDFGWRGYGVISGYIEYEDHTPLSLDLDEPVKKNMRFLQSHVIKNGFIIECTKYVFTKQGEPLPKPTILLHFFENRIEINASKNVVETWIYNNYNRIRPKDGSGFSVPYGYSDINCDGQPKGEKGDKIEEKIEEDNIDNKNQTKNPYSGKGAQAEYNFNALKLKEKALCEALYKKNKTGYYQFCTKSYDDFDQLKEHIIQIEDAVKNGLTPPPTQKQTVSPCSITPR